MPLDSSYQTLKVLFVLEQNALLLYRGWLLVVLRIYMYIALAVFQLYRNLKAGDNQSLKFKWSGGESNPGPLAPQAKELKYSATTTPSVV